jgi:hypothetical protein
MTNTQQLNELVVVLAHIVGHTCIQAGRAVAFKRQELLTPVTSPVMQHGWPVLRPDSIWRSTGHIGIRCLERAAMQIQPDMVPCTSITCM